MLGYNKNYVILAFNYILKNLERTMLMLNVRN